MLKNFFVFKKSTSIWTLKIDIRKNAIDYSHFYWLKPGSQSYKTLFVPRRIYLSLLFKKLAFRKKSSINQITPYHIYINSYKKD